MKHIYVDSVLILHLNSSSLLPPSGPPPHRHPPTHPPTLTPFPNFLYPSSPSLIPSDPQHRIPPPLPSSPLDILPRCSSADDGIKGGPKYPGRPHTRLQDTAGVLRLAIASSSFVCIHQGSVLGRCKMIMNVFCKLYSRPVHGAGVFLLYTPTLFNGHVAFITIISVVYIKC